VFCILVTWGILSTSTAFVETPTGFYAIRFFLGVAEAGFFPGMLLYLTYWFPRAQLARYTSNFMIAIPLSFVIGGPLATSILELDGVAGLRGWQWVFLVEGIPASLLAFAALKLLPDGPERAAWLTNEEKRTIASRLVAEEPTGGSDLWPALIDPRVIMLGLANFTSQVAALGAGLWMPQVVQAMGFSNRATGFVTAAIFAAGAAAMFICGRSSASRGERIWHAAIPWLFAALGFAAATVELSDLFILVALAVGSTGLFAALGPLFSLPSSFLRGRAAAGGIGVFNTLGNLGAFLGPTLFGVLTQGSGEYGASLMAVAVAFLLSSLIILVAGRLIGARRSRPSGQLDQIDRSGLTIRSK
jgi:ACS family tartrate transporter-like MFS transporter